MRNIQKILLVYPEVPQNTYWSYKHTLPFIGKKSAMPPLGLVTVASYLPPDVDVRLVDMNMDKLRDRDIKWADAVFVSAMIVQQDSFNEVVRRCNKAGATVVAGGPYPTGSHEQIEGVDHFVLGEVEEVFAEFFADLDAGIAGKHYRPSSRPDIDALPVPRFDLLKLKAYASMSIQYSRGCPFHCEFCDIWKVYGNRPRLKSTESMLAELDELYRLGWRGAIFMVDDNFIGNKGRVKKQLLPAIIEWQKERNYPFNFFTEASINLAADDDLLDLMSEASFNEVFIGIETPSAEALAETGKIQNMNMDMAEAIRKIQNHGIEVMAGFILGFDSDTPDIPERQIEFIQRTGIARAMVGLLTALPGTDLRARLEREGRMLSESSGNNTDCMAANFRTVMDPEALRQGYCKVLGSIYDKNLKNYFERCNRVLDNADKKRTYAQREIHLGELAVLVRSLVRQPFTPYGKEYIKFITRNLVKNKEYFTEAIKFSVVGHHLYTVTRDMLRSQQIEQPN
ncbi:MAG: B12-binding domain-containing radical SAM protein [Desulfatibacillaceae bacterium]